MRDQALHSTQRFASENSSRLPRIARPVETARDFERDDGAEAALLRFATSCPG
jgi:hypothetical protein